MPDSKYFEAIFQSFPSAAVLLSADSPRFTIVDVNEAYCKGAGLCRDRMLGKAFFDVFPENPNAPGLNNVVKLRQTLNQLIDKKELLEMEAQRYDIPVWGTNDFEVRYFSSRNVPVLDGNGRVVSIIHSPIDVTAQILAEEKEKRTQAELISNQEHYRSLFDHNPDAVFSFDLEGNFLSANAQSATLAECTAEELMKITFIPLIAPEELDKVLTHFKKAEEGAIQNYNTTLITTKGNRRLINVKNMPIILNGEIVGVYGVAKDISQAYRTAQDLKKSREQLQKIMDSSSDVICTFDENRIFVKVSKASLDVWGYEPEELEGRPFTDFIFQEDLAHISQNEKKLKAAEATRFFENRYRRKDGTIITMSWSAYWNETERLAYCVARDITASKAATETIRQNEKRFGTLLKNSTDGLTLINDKGITLEISENGAKILGIGKNELIGKNLAHIVHPEDLDLISQAFISVLEAPQIIQSLEFRTLLPDKSYKWIEANFQNQLHEPSVCAMVMNFRDVTDRKLACEELTSSEERYRKLFYKNPLPMWIYEAETHYFLEVNQAAVKKYGYSPEEFLSLKITDIRPPEDIDQLISLLSDPRAKGSAKSYEHYWRHLRKDGELLYVEITSHRIDHEGREAVLVLAHDVTEKVKTDAAIKAGQEIRKLILDSALDAIICMEPNGHVTSWNRQAEKLFGWTSEEMVGKDHAAYILPETCRERHRQGLNTFLETGQSLNINNVMEVTAVDRHGRNFPIELIIVHVPHPYKEFFCAYLRDITDRKQYISAIEDQNSKLREIAWAQSHSVRGPLSRIMGIVDIINNYPSENSGQMLDALATSAKELDDVIRKIVRKTELIDV